MTAEVSSTPGPQRPAEVAAKAASYKKKQMLVVVLLIGLVIALATQPAKETGRTTQAGNITQQGETPATANPPIAQTPDSTESRKQDIVTIRELSRIELTDILKLELLVPEPVGQLAAITTAEPPQQVQAIYGSSTGHAVLVGDSIVRGGQPLPTGSEVQATIGSASPAP